MAAFLAVDGQCVLVLLVRLPDGNTSSGKDCEDRAYGLDPGSEFSARQFGSDAEVGHEVGL